jgi:short-subunit dehydrogenase
MSEGGQDFRRRFGGWAVVAGASEGIGAAFARALAARGMNVLLAARRREPLRRLAAEIEAGHRVEARPLALDLADDASLRRLAAVGNELGAGLLVFNAAFAPVGPFVEVPLEEHLRVIAVNCRAPAVLSHAMGAEMARRGGGGIILMSSLAGFQGSPCIAHYAATRAYNLVLGEGLWAELRPHGVDVLVVCAGATRTPGYEANPAPPRLMAPPVMEPDAVVAHALSELGARPSTIPGRWNRIASFVLRRLLSRRRSVLLMGESTGALARDDSDQGSC